MNLSIAARKKETKGRHTPFQSSSSTWPCSTALRTLSWFSSDKSSKPSMVVRSPSPSSSMVSLMWPMILGVVHPLYGRSVFAAILVPRWETPQGRKHTNVSRKSSGIVRCQPKCRDAARPWGSSLWHPCTLCFGSRLGRWMLLLEGC